jgi:hypothetical protein
LQVNFESLVNWKQQSDYLRCSPSFYHQERYDCVLIHGKDHPFFAHLVLLFTSAIAGQTYPLALIQPYDAPIGYHSCKDKDLQFWRVRAKPRFSTEFISVHSIIRGVLLVPDSEAPGDYLVVDGIDTDMFLHINAMRKAAGY